MASVLRRGPLQIVMNHESRSMRVMDTVSGQGFHRTFSGEIRSLADGITCIPGKEFTDYVRSHISEFPFSHTQAAGRKIDDLWPNRRLKVEYSSGERMAKVVSWYESNYGPLNDCTWWSLELKMAKQRKDFAVGDVVELNGSVEESMAKYNGEVGTIVAEDTEGEAGRVFEVLLREYDNEINDFKEVRIPCKPENLKVERIIEFGVDAADVDSGGTLKGMFSQGMQEIVPFTWIDPPELSSGQGPCFHGSTEESFQDRTYSEAIAEYLHQATTQQSSGDKHQEITSEAIKKFVIDLADLVTEEFCQYLYAWCMKQYTENNLEDEVRMDDVKYVLSLANNLRHRYIPESKSGSVSSEDVEALSRRCRDLSVERGLVKTLVRELHCPCIRALQQKNRLLDRVYKCFGCASEHPKSGVQRCARCQFACYCSKECQVGDWPMHKATCKEIVKLLKARPAER